MRTWRYIHLGEELSGTILQVIDAIVQHIGKRQEYKTKSEWKAEYKTRSERKSRVQDVIRMKQTTPSNATVSHNDRHLSVEKEAQ